MISIVSRGASADHTLKHHRRGKILAVFERSFYLQADRHSLICIGPLSLGAGPLQVLYGIADHCNWQSRGIQPGTVWRYDRHLLNIGYQLKFDFADSRIWRPEVLPVAEHHAASEQGLTMLVDVLREQFRPVGLGVLITALIDDDLMAFHASDDHLLRHAVSAVVALIDGLRVADSRRLLNARTLIGLGPGLTPSGDDFIGGLLIALHTLGRIDKARLLAKHLLPVAAAATGTISFAHLRCAAEGTGSQALHDISAALYRADRAKIISGLSTIDRMGHSSGWDMLAGLVCGYVILTSGTDSIG